MTVPISDLQEASPSAIVELFELQLVANLHGSSDIYRWHNGTNANSNGEVVFASNNYAKLPIIADGFEYKGGKNHRLPRPKIRISNLLSTVTSILSTVNNFNAGSDLVGAKLTRIRTLVKYLDAANFSGGNSDADSSMKFPDEIYYIDRKSTENRDMVEFECCSVFDMPSVKLPKRQALPSLFPGIGAFHG